MWMCWGGKMEAFFPDDLDFLSEVVDSLIFQDSRLWGFRAPRRVESFEQLLWRMGEEDDTCPWDSREEDCQKPTENTNERAIPYTSVAH